MLEGQQMISELLHRHLHEAGHLVQRHGRVELQVGPDSREHQLLLDLFHEHLQLQFERLLQRRAL